MRIKRSLWQLYQHRSLSSSQLPSLQSHRIISYNILSPSHIEEYYSNCDVRFLELKYRFDLVKKKLKKEIEQNSIICLQEVSKDWTNLLIPYFKSQGYRFLTAQYGGNYTHSMGVGIAYPLSCYDLIDTDITRIAETKQQFSSSDIQFNLCNWLNDFISSSSPLSSLFSSFSSSSSSLNLDETAPLLWLEVNRRPNLMMTLELSPKQSSISPSSSLYSSPYSSFLVGTYHMPCVYYIPAVMAIHCCLATQHIQRLSKHKKPYIFAGDFNIKPQDPAYHLLTTGHLSQSLHSLTPSPSPTSSLIPSLSQFHLHLHNHNHSHQDHHHNRPLDSNSWRLAVNPMRSSYQECLGHEPPYTNNTKMKKTDTKFCETLDYIFISPEWSVQNVIPIPELGEDYKGVNYPSESEPSDHVMIGADLELKQERLSLWGMSRRRSRRKESETKTATMTVMGELTRILGF